MGGGGGGKESLLGNMPIAFRIGNSANFGQTLI